jgi:thioredoxin-like negative regulator of GroEL
MEVALGDLQVRYAGRAAIARVDVKRSPDLARRYAITCLPTILVFERGRVVRRFLGTALPWELEDALLEAIPAAAGAPES